MGAWEDMVGGEGKGSGTYYYCLIPAPMLGPEPCLWSLRCPGLWLLLLNAQPACNEACLIYNLIVNEGADQVGIIKTWFGAGVLSSQKCAVGLRGGGGVVIIQKAVVTSYFPRYSWM